MRTNLNQRILFVVIALTMATLSCSTARWFIAKLCEATGGTWIETLGDPDNGYCSHNKPAVTEPQAAPSQLDQVSESAGTLAFETESDLPSEETAAQVDPQNEEAQASPNQLTNLTYIGSTSIASTWVDTWGGQIISDEITIHIDPQGNVSGAILSIWESGRSDPVEWEDGSCVTEGTRTVTADLSGTDIDQNPIIQMQFTHVYEIQRYGCPSGNEIISDSWTTDAQVVISGNKISGSTSDGFTFEAIKQ